MATNFTTDNLDKAFAYGKLLGWPYVAIDNDNKIHAYRLKPYLGDTMWLLTALNPDFELLGYYTGDIPWQKSLRPMTT